MDLKQSLEIMEKAVFEADHELNCCKAIIAELERMNPELFHKIMEKLNLV